MCVTNGKILQHRTCSTPQCRISVDQKMQLSCEGGRVTGFQIRYLHAPSLSLRARSGTHRGKGSRSRSKDCFYGQAVSEPDPSAPESCEVYWADNKRDSNAGHRSFSPQGSGEWLKDRNKLKRSSWNTDLIDCPQKKWFKYFNSWCLRENGKQAMQTNAQRKI